MKALFSFLLRTHKVTYYSVYYTVVKLQGLTSQRRDSFGSVDLKRPIPYYGSLGSPSPVGSLGFMPPGTSLTPPATSQLTNPGNGLSLPGEKKMQCWFAINLVFLWTFKVIPYAIFYIQFLFFKWYRCILLCS